MKPHHRDFSEQQIETALVRFRVELYAAAQLMKGQQLVSLHELLTEVTAIVEYELELERGGAS